MKYQPILFLVVFYLFFCFNITENNNLLPTSKTSKKIPIERKIAITLEAVLQLSNDHVGNDWEHFLVVQKKVIKKGETEIFTLKTRAPLYIEAHSIETDKDFSDSGKEHIDFIYSDLIAIKKNRFELDVAVVENSGQYAGNRAVWKFLFVIQQVE